MNSVKPDNYGIIFYLLTLLNVYIYLINELLLIFTKILAINPFIEILCFYR